MEVAAEIDIEVPTHREMGTQADLATNTENSFLQTSESTLVTINWTSIEDFKGDAAGVSFNTGLDSYATFCDVLDQ